MKALCVFVIAAFFLNFANAENKIVFYNNEYQGIKPGISTLADAVEAMGKPLSKKLYKTYVKYYFDTANVTIRDLTGRVRGINILDKVYVDKNNLKIGDDRSIVEDRVVYKIPREKSISDISNGIVYHFDESDKVNKIVLTNEFAIKPKYQEFWDQLLQKNKK